MSAGAGLPDAVLLGAAALCGLLVAGLRLAAAARARRDREALAEPVLLRRLLPMPGGPRTAARVLLPGLGAGALAAAALGAGRPPAPPAGEDAAQVETALVLDASNSMLATDVEPSRLERQREIAAELASRLGGRLGVVYFAGRGYVLSPLTADRSAVLMYVGAVSPMAVGRGGTALGLGLRQGLAVLAGGQPGAARRLVLLSDGEETLEDDERDAVLQQAAGAGVRIYAVGIGTPEGAPVPTSPGGEPLVDEEGRPVRTRLREAELRDIARATGGLYVPGRPAGVEILARELSAGTSRRAGAAAVPLLLLLALSALFVDAYLLRSG
ncbi:MAG: VWA domain-containing protein [Gemmatimonadota bacterium]